MPFVYAINDGTPLFFVRTLKDRSGGLLSGRYGGVAGEIEGIKRLAYPIFGILWREAWMRPPGTICQTCHWQRFSNHETLNLRLC
jgi:hypothetical protein